jgi:hypothetical protein
VILQFWTEEIGVMFLCSLCKKLQADVTHRSRIADNVASASEEQVDVFAQLPCVAEIERHVLMKAQRLPARFLPERAALFK